MSKDLRIYLKDLLERIGRIEETAAAGRSTFYTSYMHQDSIIRSFEVIGEIVKRLPDELTAAHPQIRWADWAGFRDVLIHQYDQVLLDTVWRAATDEIMPLKAAVEALIERLNADSASDGEQDPPDPSPR